MKIRQTSTSLIFERQPPDSQELVATGAFTFVDAATPSIRDSLEALSVDELRTALGQALATVPAGTKKDDLIARLTPLVEAGTVTL